MLSPENKILNDLLVGTYNNIGKVEERMLRNTKNNDLSICDMHMLECVSQSPRKEATISEIAQALGITLPTVTVAVKRLQQKGYVTKQRDASDGRVMQVALTPQGKKMDAAHRYFHENMVRTIVRDMEPDELSSLMSALARLNDFFESKISQGDA